jgi:hypothetical protein
MMGYTWYHYLLVMVIRILLMGKSTINGKIHYIILYYKCKNLIFVDWFFFRYFGDFIVYMILLT